VGRGLDVAADVALMWLLMWWSPWEVRIDRLVSAPMARCCRPLVALLVGSCHGWSVRRSESRWGGVHPGRSAATSFGMLEPSTVPNAG